MPDIEHDFDDYRDAVGREGGLHPGRAAGPGGMAVAVLVAGGILALGVVALLLIG